MFKLEDYKLESGKLQSYAFPGGYPLYYLCKDSGVICPSCVNSNLDLIVDKDDAQWYIVAADVNYEDTDLTCDHCHKPIEAAYTE